MSPEELILVDEANRLAEQIGRYPLHTPCEEYEHLEEAWHDIVIKLMQDFSWTPDMLCDNVTCPEF